VSDFQLAHDGGQIIPLFEAIPRHFMTPEIMKIRLHKIAEKYNLTIPVGEDNV
jgi:hypothetical protein